MRTKKVVLSDEEFAQLRHVLARSAGLVFDEARRDSVAYCIAERLRATGVRDVSTYLGMLSDPAERQQLLNEVTIQETHFFRNPPQIRALRKYVIPELLKHADTNGRRIRIWSAGCSTGEEPYTIAMLLRELLPTTAGWDVKVVATDVSSRALEAAKRGRYGERAVQMASPDDLARFFVASGSGHYEVRPEVRNLVEFRHQNLVTDPVPFAPDERIDLVLCRNVTIYFSRETTRGLMARLHACLRDGGYLFLGHSETLWQVSEDFRLVPLGTGDSAAFVYRRIDEPPKERRGTVLPDRRTEDEGPPQPKPERRAEPRRDRTSVPAAAPVAPASAVAVRAALADGKYDDAVTAASNLVTAEPLNPMGHYLRGLALVNAGKDGDALVDLRKAVYLDPASGLGHFLLAGALHRLGDPAAAAREYRAAADTLGKRAAERTAPELGGRSVQELAALCRQLEEQLTEVHS
ncbi:MAG: chemotaxis protein methyltransferase CheR [Actinomycetota bacterium]|jgi:chemotaxis protein methyltransferase CheR|nr:chemotaxis protein methyltransferase CheR [Actinomycetota bacterium]